MSENTARPLVIAHRGASGLEPEHTEAAYRRALADGADGFECDVRLTRDRELVCLHDRTVERTARRRGVVSELTLEQLRQMDFGSWKGGQPATVLTLEDLLEIAVGANRPLVVTIETKHPTRYGGAVEKSLVALLERFGLAADPGRDGVTVRIMSFSPAALRTAVRCAPGLQTVALMSRLPRDAGKRPLFGGARIAGPSLTAIKADPGYVQRAHARGDEVFVWTVDEAADIELLAGLGVEAVITNRPDLALAALSR